MIPKNKKADEIYAAPAQKAKKMLLLHLIIGAAAFFSAFILKSISLYECVFHSVTGLYCPGCGTTRAAREFFNVNILRSIFYNPLPVLITLFFIILIAYDVYAVVRKDSPKYRWCLCYFYTVFAIEIAYCIWRNYVIIKFS